MTHLYSSILWCAAQVTIFLCLAAPIYLAVRRRNPRSGTLAAAASLGVVVLLSALASSPWPRWSWDAAANGGEATAVPHTAVASVGGVAAQTAGVVIRSSVPLTETSLVSQLWQAIQTATEEPVEPQAAAQASWRPVDFFVAAIALGIALGLLHTLIGLVALRRLVARSRPVVESAPRTELTAMQRDLGVTAPLAMRESNEIATPATIGWRRPVILLPPAWRQWTSVERRAVLAHELSHIARNDFGAWLLARVAVAIHFYHPLVRWFARRLQLDQELSADAAAAPFVGGRTDYLHALASLALATPAHRLAGPARTFIPSRSLLLRRIEMLRTNDASTYQLSCPARISRWISGGVLVVAAIAAAGLRAPGAADANAAEAPAAPTSTAAAGKQTAYDFAYVPDDFMLLMSLRPQQLAASPRLKPLADLLSESMRPGVPSGNLDQITLVMPTPALDKNGNMLPGSGSEYTVVRTDEPMDFKPLLQAGYGEIKTEARGDKELITWGDSEYLIAFYSPDERTLISHPKIGLVKVMDNPNAAQPPANAADWSGEATGPFFATGNIKQLRKLMSPVGIVAGLIGPVLDATERATLSIEDAEPATIRAKLVLHDAKDSPMVQKTIESALILARNLISAQRNALEAQAAKPLVNGDPAAKLKLDRVLALFDHFDRLAKLDVQVTADGNVVIAEASIDNVVELVAKSIPMLQQARTSARQSVTANNLRQLAIAVQNYHDAYKSMPPAAVYGKSRYGALNPTGDDASDVPRSWRVEILPLIEQSELYKQYRLDQPWDSEANRKVLAKMPAIFRSPHDANASTNTSFFAVTGPGTLFDDKDGTRFQDVTDGLSQTILFVEANQPTPWTKPEDIDYAPDQPLPKFGGWQPGGFVAAYVDGSSRTLDPYGHGDPAAADETLRMLIEKADGKDASHAPAARPVPAAAPAQP